MRPARRLPGLVTLLLVAAAARGAEAQTPAPADTALRAVQDAAPPAAAPDPDSIVARAIQRRRKLLAAGPVRYDAFVKVVVRDLRPRRDTARAILFLAETRSSAYAAPRRRFQEMVAARRQSRGLGPPRGLVAVDEIVDVNRSSVVLGGYAGPAGFREGREGRRARSGAAHRYTLPLPIARGASRRYDFRLLDTVTVAGRRAFRLAVIPRSSTTPLFVGTLEIADSTWDVLAMDLGVNDAVRFGAVRALRYTSRFADAGDGRWLPAEFRLSGEVRPRITAGGLPREVAGVPIPGLPETVAFEQVAALGGYAFGVDEPPQGLGEFRVVVADDADRADIATWDAPGAPPLSAAEREAWARSDSAARHPPALIRIGQGVGAVGELASNPGYFHYNRVDGYYVGLAPTWQAAPGLVVDTKLGYDIGSETWQYRAGGQVRLSEERRMYLGASYGDETVSRPTLISNRYNPTFRALFTRVDPLDYYRQRGLHVTFRTKLLDLTELELGYDDQRQWSLDTLPGTSYRSQRYAPRGNPPIAPGRLRTASATLSWDSREMVRSRRGTYRLDPMRWTRITGGFEIAPRSAFAEAYSYRRFTLEITRAQPLLGWGTTTVSAVGGIATGFTPPQRYFTVDFGMDVLVVEGSGFRTLSRTNYYGNRAAVLTLRHDFGRLLFARSVLPLVRDLPFTLSVQGGLFWAAFVDHAPFAGDTMLASAPTPYSELGFSLGNLTPFLSPFNLAASFTWQLSSYATRRFRLGLGISGP